MIEVNTNIPKQMQKDFPKLMIADSVNVGNKAGGTIVLFTEPNKGTVIYCPNGYYALGYVSDSFSMGFFSDHNELVTIRNID